MDLVYVSYNSEKWIDRCFASVMKSDYDLKSVSVYAVDNASSDSSVKKLYEAKKKYQNQIGRAHV